MDADWLQYGALGLLALVLGGIGVVIRSFVLAESKRNADESARRATADEWVRSLIQADRIEREASIIRLDKLVQDGIAAQKQSAIAFVELCAQIRTHDAAVAERQARILEKLSKEA